jgi:molecular chaperone DnaK (HSP70)
MVIILVYFNDSKRSTPEDVGMIIRFKKVMLIINNPTTASISYGLDKKASNVGGKNVLIIYMDGGKFDVSVLTILM